MSHILHRTLEFCSKTLHVPSLTNRALSDAKRWQMLHGISAKMRNAFRGLRQPIARSWLQGSHACCFALVRPSLWDAQCAEVRSGGHLSGPVTRPRLAIQAPIAGGSSAPVSTRTVCFHFLLVAMPACLSNSVGVIVISFVPLANCCRAQSAHHTALLLLMLYNSAHERLVKDLIVIRHTSYHVRKRKTEKQISRLF